MTVRLAEMIAEAYDEKHGLEGEASMKNNPKKMLKLIQKTGKQKEVLSANKEASIFMEI